MTREHNDILGFLTRQFEMAWNVAWYHLEGLDTSECLWRPAGRGLHVEINSDGKWVAQWPEKESYDIGPPNIAWLTWHMGFWWSMVLNHSFGRGTLSRERIFWPGSASGVRNWLLQLHDEWQRRLSVLTEDQFQSNERTMWPFQERPFGDVVAWVNVELVKNASEIGYARFLYASRPDAQQIIAADV